MEVKAGFPRLYPSTFFRCKLYFEADKRGSTIGFSDHAFRPFLRRNPDPGVIFNKVILINKIKTYLYTMSSKYGTITIRKHTLMMFLNTQSPFLGLRLSCFLSLRNFDSTFHARSETAYIPVVFFYSISSLNITL